MIRPGTGPIVEEVDLRGRKVSLGVAVCMDYLRLEEEAREQEPEILCIPAYSPGCSLSGRMHHATMCDYFQRCRLWRIANNGPCAAWGNDG